MQKLRDILTLHASLYPKMRPCDAVKLIYQNEFGGGHLIRDPEESLAYIKAEYERTPRRCDAPFTVPIGRGIVRVDLSALDIEVLSLDRLNEIFVESSRAVTGNMDSLHAKLDVLRILTRIGTFAFDECELEAYLSEYEAAGCPMVSHSEEYRREYAPAYRIVLEKLIENIQT